MLDKEKVSDALLSVKGKPVKIRHGPAAVTGDFRCIYVTDEKTHREGAASQDDPEVRRPI